jgi:hypothetical protein
VEQGSDLVAVAHDSDDLQPAATTPARAVGDVDGKDVSEQPRPTAAGQSYGVDRSRG